MIEENKAIELKGKLVGVRYNYPNTFGYICIENEDGKFEVMCDHRPLQNIIECESVGNCISVSTFKGQFQKIK